MEVRYPPPPPHKRGISAILARYHMKTRQMGATFPSAILSRRGIARYGGVSRIGPLRFQVSISINQKNTLAHEYKNAPPLKGGILRAWRFSCRKNAIFPGAHKIGAAISGPRNANKNVYGHEDFSEQSSWASMTSGVTPANQTKERPVHELLLNSQKKWTKFMDFSFWPCLWFGSPGRL